jgi:hypothetical protein
MNLAPEPYITQFDAEAAFWQFLNNLTADGLIIELIQNDLDAHAIETHIQLETDRLICKGNGLPVDSDGWKRLSFMTGAGKEAPRKHNRIGVKNHGLKTCFTIGDEILIRSDGKRTKQTLYRDGPNAPPAPAAYISPLPDESAPREGCRIEVPYRRRPLMAGDGEPLELVALTDAVLDSMFLRASDEAPMWFLGAIRPRVRDRYTIHLRHYRLGSTVLAFTCSSPRRVSAGEIFTRTCTVTREGQVSIIRETAFVFETVPGARKEVPEFYQSGEGTISEISWRVDKRGTPIPVTGRRRYPIAYPGPDLSGRTGIGVHYSAPFVSDLERYGTSPAKVNEDLVYACDAAFVKLLRDYLVGRYGARVMRLLIDASEPQPDRLVQMMERMLADRSVPLATRWVKPQFGPRRSIDGCTRPVVIPAFTWTKGEISAELRATCPKDLDQIDPAVPAEIIRLLASGDGGGLSGWKETWVTFDQHDVLALLQPKHEIGYFPWESEASWRRALGNPGFVLKCLDVVSKALKHMSAEEVEKLRRCIHLPDSHRFVRPLSEMFLRNRLPTELAGLGLPPLLHDAVAAHSVLRQRGWRPSEFTLQKFLDLISFETEAAPKRARLSAWIRRNYRDVPTSLWSRLAGLPIWPGADGEYYRLAELCQPNDVRIARVLFDVIHLPGPEILGFQYIRRSKQRGVRLRTAVLELELAAFCRNRLAKFPLGRTLTAKQIENFHRFEEELAILATDVGLSPMLTRHVQVGVAKDGMIRPLSQLHASTSEVEGCFLDGRDLLSRIGSGLDKVLPARSHPSSDALTRALQGDAGRVDCLLIRLRSLKNAAAERKMALPVGEIRCIPVDGGLFSAAALAFKGSHGDYWGAWKRRLSGAGLSADAQELYRFAGVTSAEPNGSTSLAFFEWLKSQPAATIAAHLEMIVRHLGHQYSVQDWWEQHCQLPCVPVEVAGTVQLVSPQDIRRRRVFLPDSEDLVQSIRLGKPNPRIMLAIISHPNVSKPVSDIVRTIGARSLREEAASPASVCGEETGTAPDELLRLLTELRSRKLTNLAKRLSALDFPHGHLREQWRNRLDRIDEVRLARSVTAVFHLCGRQYAVTVRSAFDEETRVLWIKRAQYEKLVEAVYEAVAERIFQNAPKYAAMVLQKAVQSQFREHLTVAAEPSRGEDDHDNIANIPLAVDIGENPGDKAPDPGPTETFPTHHPYNPSQAPNIPNPGTIPTALPPNIQRVRFPNRSTPASPRCDVPLESAQKADLKEKQYAWHCQICLAIKAPSELAPAGSYVELAVNRQKIMEAHHPDHVAAGGARDAGNLLVLCYKHHHEFGNTLNREVITNALADTATSKTISFRNGDRNVEVKGCLATVRITERTVRLFFTAEHKEHWLSIAGRKGTGSSVIPEEELRGYADGLPTRGRADDSSRAAD